MTHTHTHVSIRNVYVRGRMVCKAARHESRGTHTHTHTRTKTPTHTHTHTHTCVPDTASDAPTMKKIPPSRPRIAEARAT